MVDKSEPRQPGVEPLILQEGFLLYTPDTMSQPPETSPNELPQLDPKVVELIPASAAKLFKIIPVEGTPEHLRTVCTSPLTNEQIEHLKFMCPGREFEFSTDPREFPDVRRNIHQLIAYHFPQEEGVIDCDTLVEMPERGV